MQRYFAAMAALLLLGASALARADTPSTADTVFLGGAVIMRVRVPAGGYTIPERAAMIQRRVNTILGGRPIVPSDVVVQPMGSEAVVMVKGHLLFTADWATARYNDTTPMALAEHWADEMRQVLPKLTHS